MIVLDTNVVSETMRPHPDDGVLTWLNAQAAKTLYLSSVTLAELLFGIGVLPSGDRRDRLGRALQGLLNLFDDRVLPFGPDAVTDGYIAATAAARGFAVATRNVRDFDSTGVDVINPWEGR